MCDFEQPKRWPRRILLLRGFTIIEVIIVFIILSVLTIVTVNWLDQGANLDAATKQLAADIRYMQYLSMTNAKRYRIVFTGTSYSFREYNTGTGVNRPGTGSSTTTLSSGVTLATTNLPNDYIVFDSKGVPYTDNNIPGTPLATNATVTLSGYGASKTVTILPETGKVSVN